MRESFSGCCYQTVSLWKEQLHWSRNDQAGPFSGVAEELRRKVVCVKFSK